ncbi:anaphase-promoting complex subunit Cut9 [Malassezia yamatoensis]|uniref:Anaphase-promoting complex subunit Cut9 n=1 Tax=Malassezia yamatoensis TaxID=253288 RepID=A0AAJ6CGD3_9BASI|nr:anaphase-promoting complex subunit Cut9 [Malassezia yamatoensis]
MPLGIATYSDFGLDGSMSMVRPSEDASNSGLLDLDPMLSPVQHLDEAQQDNLHTPVLGPGENERFLRMPPLRSKARYKAPRRSSTESQRVEPMPQTAQQSSGVRIPSDESDHSVIIHDEGQSITWENSPEKTTSKNPRTDDAIEAQLRLAARMRRWMHDAMKQHMYETAIFWGRQVVALETTETAYNDAYWLAQAYFLTHQYAHTEQLLTKPLLSGATRSSDGFESPVSKGVASSSDTLHDALQATRSKSILPDSIRNKAVLAEDSGEDELKVDHMLGTPDNSTQQDRARRSGRERSRSIDATENVFHAKSKDAPTFMPIDQEIERLTQFQKNPQIQGPCLVNWSTPCRYLAAQAQVRQGKYHEALEIIGEDHTRWTGGGKTKPALDGGLKLGSSVCHLRGQIYLRLDEVEKAKESFMLALSLDVKNYDSFTALIDGSLLSADEQWDFIQTLEYAAQAGTEPGARDDFESIRMMYTMRLSKKTASMAQAARQARTMLLQKHNALRANPDILLSLADGLYSRMRYDDAYKVTSHILELEPSYWLALPIHIACMYYVPHLRPALFLLAHQLTEADPESCEAWYAVGVWYASASRWAEARRFFSKSSLLDPRFAPSWIAFGHSFSMEGESDQAITAYSTAARRFQSSGLPLLFIGMEHLLQGNRNLAILFLDSSAEELGDDPLCLNERGRAAFLNDQNEEALDYFQRAIRSAEATQQPAKAWVNVRLNLGLAYSRLRRDEKARVHLLRVIESDPSCATAYIALGLCAQRQGDLASAIDWYHEGLGIDPRDAIGTELLTMALEARLDLGLPSDLLEQEAQEAQEGTRDVMSSDMSHESVQDALSTSSMNENH